MNGARCFCEVSMGKPWDMARVASRRELPKQRKMLGPIGRNAEAWKRFSSDPHCEQCGYHVCGCPVPVQQLLTKPPLGPVPICKGCGKRLNACVQTSPCADSGLICGVPYAKSCSHERLNCTLCQWVNGTPMAAWR